MSQPEMKPPPGIDRISALPDEMLIHILSFLPTKSAFTTTVLSKRWTPLCHSLTALNFDDEGVRDNDAHLRFRDAVNTVLLSPRVQHRHPIQSFRLKSRWLDCHARHVGGWVEAANRRGVENLELSSSCMSMWIAPLSLSIFTSQTLVVLKLKGVHMQFGDDFGSVDLPLLRTLHLKLIFIRKREEFMKFLSGCPNLVGLYAPDLFSHHYYDNRRFKAMPKLEKACISALDVPFTVIYNVQFLRREMMERMAKDKYINSYAQKLINSYYKSIPVFQNLISIELCFYLLLGWDGVVEVLPFCPKLQTLVIEKSGHRRFHKEKWAYTESVPECVLLHLRTCSIGIYQGMYDDFDFAAYIMQNGRLLQVMTLHSGTHTKESEKDKFFKQLSRCPRISPTCKLFFDTKEIPIRT